MKICPEYQCRAKFQNYSTVEKLIISKRNFVSIDFKMRFGQISYNAQGIRQIVDSH